MPPMTLICAYEQHWREATSRRCRRRHRARKALRAIERLQWIDEFRLP